MLAIVSDRSVTFSSTTNPVVMYIYVVVYKNVTDVNEFLNFSFFKAAREKSLTSLTSLTFYETRATIGVKPLATYR